MALKYRERRESLLHCHIFDRTTKRICRKLLNTTILSKFPFTMEIYTGPVNKNSNIFYLLLFVRDLFTDATVQFVCD